MCRWCRDLLIVNGEGEGAQLVFARGARLADETTCFNRGEKGCNDYAYQEQVDSDTQVVALVEAIDGGQQQAQDQRDPAAPYAGTVPECEVTIHGRPC